MLPRKEETRKGRAKVFAREVKATLREAIKLWNVPYANGRESLINYARGPLYPKD